eukprot:scpid22461/ scgid33900/ Unconventional myosin-Id; Myosin heavy chain myr 4
MGEETPKENGPVTTAAVTNGDDHDRQGEAEADGGAASRLARRKSIRDQITGIGDLVLLDPLTEEALLTNLRRRYSNDEIYTYIGLVVISINPYKSLKAYSSDVVQEYRSRSVYETKPHIYAIADSAYRWLRDKHQNQCIIISGESGSGKTEASKIVMRYVASVCGKEKEVDRVMQMLLQSNPLLEAFGNAKTTRNDNSSRFGKYMEIEFNFKGEPLGGEITNYLLEKSRLVAQAEGERNFHIFYQLLASAAVSQLQGLRLKRELDAYHYLRGAGGVREESDINDKANFKDVELAMVAVGLKKPEMRAIFRLIAAVLILGNISFSSVERADEDEACELNGRQAVQDLGFLLEGDEAILEKALTEKTVDTLKEQVTVALSVEKAMFARDALAKALYGRMFNWLVHRVNNSIKVTAAGKRKSIGVLDIYGFEIFKLNSFEQFIINYCNEKLQQLVIELVLKREQDEYAKEEIPWVNVDYFNNEAICNLIEDPTKGIIAMLDEECLRPGTQEDKNILVHMNKVLSNHKHFDSAKTPGASNKQLDRDTEFQISHYAGKVVYRVTGFVDKNKDTLFQDLKRLLYSCDRQMLKDMWPEGASSESEVTKRPHSTATGFKLSMATLVDTLASKEPYYVRCIKPNAAKAAGEFDLELVVHQVRYLGLMENVRVRRAGYSYRQKHELFLERYKMLSKETWPRWKKESKAGCEAIVNALKINSELTMGKTKVFIKRPNTVFSLEQKRLAEMPRMATIIQTAWRAWLARKYFRRLKAIVCIKRRYKSYRNRLFFSKVNETFRDVRLLPDLGTSLSWPDAPPVLQQGLAMMKTIHKYWRARMVVQRLTPAEQEHVKMKIIAAEFFGGGKMDNWGVSATWPGNALAQPTNPLCPKFNEQAAALRSQFGDSTFIYSATGEKLGRNMKTSSRAYVLSEANLFRLELPEFAVNKKKPPLSLQTVTGVSVLKNGAPGMVVHLKDHAEGDLVFALANDRRVAELLAVLYQTILRKQGRKIAVTISNELTYVVEGKNRTLDSEPAATGTPLSFKKVSGLKATLVWPK